MVQIIRDRFLTSKRSFSTIFFFLKISENKVVISLLFFKKRVVISLSFLTIVRNDKSKRSLLGGSLQKSEHQFKSLAKTLTSIIRYKITYLTNYTKLKLHGKFNRCHIGREYKTKKKGRLNLTNLTRTYIQVKPGIIQALHYWR